MSDFTALRVSIESDAVATALDALPGISVVNPGDRPDSGRVDLLPGGDTDDSSESSDTPGGVTETPFEPEEGAPPAWREYALLGVGAALVTVGIATVGIWWYRRRSGDGTDEWSPEAGETPAPIDPETADGSTADAGTPSDAEMIDPERAAIDDDERVPTDDDDDTDGQTVLGDEMPDVDAEPPSRSEDRDDVEWTTRTDPVSPEPDEPDVESATESDASEPAADPRDQIDVAPLLGVAFLAVSGAVVRWVQRAGDAE